MLGNFVFDIDGTIAIALDYERERKEKDARKILGDEFIDRHKITAFNYPHLIFPGYYALFKWLHDKGAKLFFFSSGIEERNKELAQKLMTISFGEKASEIDYKVFSQQHCIDTTYYYNRSLPDIYQSFFYGQLKKKLGGIVVPESEVPETLLIDDDNSYMVKGEEYNFVGLKYCHEYASYYPKEELYVVFLKAYYLAGLFAKIFEVKNEKNISLIEAAKFVQIDSENAVLSRDFYYHGAYRPEYYEKGLEILKQIDNSLQMYFKLPNNDKLKELSRFFK